MDTQKSKNKITYVATQLFKGDSCPGSSPNLLEIWESQTQQSDSDGDSMTPPCSINSADTTILDVDDDENIQIDNNENEKTTQLKTTAKDNQRSIVNNDKKVTESKSKSNKKPSTSKSTLPTSQTSKKDTREKSEAKKHHEQTTKSQHSRTSSHPSKHKKQSSDSKQVSSRPNKTHSENSAENRKSHESSSKSNTNDCQKVKHPSSKSSSKDNKEVDIESNSHKDARIVMNKLAHTTSLPTSSDDDSSPESADRAKKPTTHKSSLTKRLIKMKQDNGHTYAVVFSDDENESQNLPKPKRAKIEPKKDSKKSSHAKKS